MTHQNLLKRVFEQLNLAVGLDQLFHVSAENRVLLVGEMPERGNRDIHQPQPLGRIQSGPLREMGKNLRAQSVVRINQRDLSFAHFFLIGEKERVNERARSVEFATGGLCDLGKPGQQRSRLGHPRLTGKQRFCQPSADDGLLFGSRRSRSHRLVNFDSRDIEPRRNFLNPLLNWRVCRKEGEPRIAGSIAKKQMTRLLGPRVFYPRGKLRNFCQRPGKPLGIPRVLHGRGVGQEFPLPAHGGFDELAEEDPDPAHKIKRQAGAHEKKKSGRLAFPIPIRRTRSRRIDPHAKKESADQCQK